MARHARILGIRLILSGVLAVAVQLSTSIVAIQVVWCCSHFAFESPSLFKYPNVADQATYSDTLSQHVEDEDSGHCNACNVVSISSDIAVPVTPRADADPLAESPRTFAAALDPVRPSPDVPIEPQSGPLDALRTVRILI